ncbi:MFS domain-containing histidine kinase [Rubricoccus marinus]|uniref:histidine kinase n=1 Tax=Rubricoccus marinus TaxID=716817 RepID=A0A259U2C1_9BACT|nr:ATP-binding protein [Rubricoccus marinus]OZC04185.1 hypothetical protein BSZ36_15060 [Rubricoccus marinus]
MRVYLPISLNPFLGEADHDVIVLRTLRLALCLCLGLIPAFGVAFAVGGVFDVLWIRAVATCATGLTLALTYSSKRAQARPLPLLAAYLGGLLVWIGMMAYSSRLMPEVAVGFLFTLFAAGSLLGASVRRVRPLAWYLAVCSIGTVGIGLAVPNPLSDVGVFVLSASATCMVLIIMAYARIREQNAREERDRTLQESEQLALMGSWSHDLRTTRRKWSDGMYRVVGIPPHPGEPPQVIDFVTPQDRSILTDDEERLLRGEAMTVDHRYSICRADGSPRRIHSIVRMITREDGRPLRLVGVAMDITEQAEREEELEQARAAAEDAAALQKSILANMSHEIRTPLTAVIGYSQLLEEEAGDDLRELIVPIRNGGERLLNTLNSVLDLARMEAGQLRINAEPLDVTQEVRTVAGLLQQQAARRGLGLTVEAPEAPLFALADTHALGRSLTNLISNAIKFTAEGSVTVRVACERTSVRIDVADTGRGMSPEFQALLFEPFRQESTGSARSHEGTGLGLTITRRLIDAMGGTISFESEEGIGTTFSILLPAAPPPAQEPAAWIALPAGTRASGEAPEVPRLSPEARPDGHGLWRNPPPGLTGSGRADA